MKTGREKLLSALESVAVGAAPKESIEQSDCFVFLDGEIRTCNGDVACRCPSPLGKHVTGSVRAKPLLAQLRLWPDREIDVTQDGKTLRIKGKGRIFKPRLEAETTNVFDHIKRPKNWKPLPEEWADAIPMASACVGTDENKPNTVRVHLTSEVIEAFDGVQACRWSFDTGIKNATLVKPLGLKNVPVLGMTEFGETEQWLHFRNPDGVELSIRKELDENYQDMSEHFGALKGSKFKFPTGLEHVVARAKELSVENGKAGDLVKIEILSDRVRVSAESVSGEFTEKKGHQWKGPDREFWIAPEVLIGVLKRDHECRIGDDLLKIKGEKYAYICCLIRPDELLASEELEEIEESETEESDETAS